MTIYLDVIWALNFLFDTLLLYLTAIFLKRSVPKWRLILGGFIGSLIILLSVTPLNAYSANPIIKMIVSALMILSAFGYHRFRFFLKGLMTLYLATFLIGGTLIGLHYFVSFDMNLSSAVMLSSVKGFGDPVSWLFVLLGFPAAWHFSKRNVEHMEMTKIQYDQLVDVTITLSETRLNRRGLIDSGNQLYDPLSKLPVMLISLNGVNSEVPAPILKMAENPDSILYGEESLPKEWESRMRIIPCKVVGQDHQLILAIKPDEIWITKDDKQHLIEKALISFSMQQLSADDSFQCIIHPKMLTGLSTARPPARVG